METFKVQYSHGSTSEYSTWRRFPIEFTDTEIIFYEHDKKGNFSLKYKNIEHVEIVFQLINTWYIDIYNKTDHLLEMKKEEIDSIKHWFPFRSFTPSLIYVSFIPNSRDKTIISNLLKTHNVRVLDSNKDFIDYYKNYTGGLDYLKKHKGLRLFFIFFLLITIITLTPTLMYIIYYLLFQTNPLTIRFILIVPTLIVLLMNYVCIKVLQQIIKAK